LGFLARAAATVSLLIVQELNMKPAIFSYLTQYFLIHDCLLYRCKKAVCERKITDGKRTNYLFWVASTMVAISATMVQMGVAMARPPWYARCPPGKLLQSLGIGAIAGIGRALQ
jgi:hypothetical protein